MRKILLLSILFISLTSIGQTWKKMLSNNRINFYEVVKSSESYFKTHNKKTKGSGYKKLMRWIYNNEYKYFPSGDRSHEDPLLLKHAWKNYLHNTPQARQLLQNNHWQEIGPRNIDSITHHYSIGLGRVIDVLPVSNDTLFLSSEAGGLWKSTDGGQTWTPKSDVLIASGADALAVAPLHHNKMYMDVQNPGNYYSYGIYRSNDGGDTWYESNFNPDNVGYGGLGDNFRIYTIKCHPTIDSLIFVGTNKGLFISTDDLQTWTQVSNIFDNAPHGYVKSIAFHPTDPNTLYIMDDNDWVNKDKIFISHDLGQTWTTSQQIVDDSGNANDRNAYLDTSPQCPDCVYFASDKGVWKSTDQGAHFTFIAKPNMGMVEGFAVNKDNPDNMIYGYVDVMNTTDGGQTWQQVTHWSLGSSNGTGSSYAEKLATATDYVHADLHPVKYQNGYFYIGTDGFMCKTQDGGNNWQIVSYGTGIRENYRLGVSQNEMNTVIIGSQDNGTGLHTEHGWVEITGGDGMEGIVLPLNENAFIGSYQHGSRFRSFDEGVVIQQMSPPSTDNAYWTAPIAYDPNNQMTIYDFRDGVWKSEDFGSNWTQLNADLFGTGYWDNIRLAEIARNNSRIMLIANRADLKKSTDGGNTFTDISGLPNLYITDVAFAPHDDNIMFTTYGNYDHPTDKIYMSLDGGVNWQNITYNLNNIPVHSLVVDNTPQHNMYAGTELGVFYKGFNDTTWLPLGQGLPKVKVSELEIQEGSNYLYVTSWGRGLWRIKLPGRENYPEIEKVSITNPPTLNFPKEGMLQTVKAKINYAGNLSSVIIKYSVNDNSLNQVMPMNLVNGYWISDTHLPDVSAGDQIYFKIVATGSNNDTTETYMYMYELKPFEYCNGSGALSGSGSELKFTSVKIIDENNQTILDNTTDYQAYTFFDSNIINLEAGKTYTIELTGAPAWHENDFAGWIDYNHDADFSDDEKIIYEIDTDGDASAQFTIPVDKIFDQSLRMRLRLANHGTNPQACDENEFGEVEDYLVKIIDTTPPQPDLATLPDITAECEVTNINLPTATDLVDGQVTGTTTTSFPITTQGTTIITWTFTDNKGNTSSQTQNVVINDTTAPVPDIADLPDITAECEVNSLTPPTATDNCAGNLTASTDVTLPITSQGTTVVTWTYNDGNGNTFSQTQNVIYTPIDNTLTQSGATLTANATGNYTYQWGDCSSGNFVAIAGETGNSFTANETGDYAVEISNGTCSVISDCVHVTISRIDINPLETIKIYPNPVKDYLFLENQRQINCSLFDLSGKILWSQNLTKGKHIIDLQKFSNGIYLLIIVQNNQSFHIKIAKH